MPKQSAYSTTKWRMVPTRLNEQMEDAALTACGLDCIEADRLYTALLEAAPQPPEQPATEYEKQNPLGGPAKVFDAMADAIRAGDSYESVLKCYGYAEKKRLDEAGALIRKQGRELGEQDVLLQQALESMCWAARALNLNPDEAPGFHKTLTAIQQHRGVEGGAG